VNPGGDRRKEGFVQCASSNDAEDADETDLSERTERDGEGGVKV